jgi:hypothetical protein
MAEDEDVGEDIIFEDRADDSDRATDDEDDASQSSVLHASSSGWC